MCKIAAANLSDLYLIYFVFFSYILFLYYYHVQKYSISTDKSGEIIVTVQVRASLKDKKIRLIFSCWQSICSIVACRLLDINAIKFMFQLQQQNKKKDE